MIKNILLIFLVSLNLPLFSQTIIELKDSEINPKKNVKKNRFSVYLDENQSGIFISSKLIKGEYILKYKTQLIAKIKYISSKEYLIYEFEDSSTIKSIEYYPYFKLYFNNKNNINIIDKIVSYKKDIIINPFIEQKLKFRIYDPEKKESIYINGTEISRNPNIMSDN